MNEDLIHELIARHEKRDGPLLPILHDIQAELGFVPDAAVPLIAQRLNLSRAEVHGTISFYHDFRRSPPSRPAFKLCRAEACQARGSEGVAKALETVEEVELEAIYCLGLCASGPAALFGQRVFARLDPKTAVSLARSVRS